ncbi:MAG: hypothetical protein U0835_17840 [Isosphaeraceae bacterium]
MKRRVLILGPVMGLVLAALGSRLVGWSRAVASPSGSVRVIEPGLTYEVLRSLAEPVNALTVGPKGSSVQGLVFAGLEGKGGVLRINPAGPTGFTTVALGMGDFIDFGTCAVNHLEVHDVDGDGLPELLGSTSQVSPMGRPRMYVWATMMSTPLLRAVARPDIQSSWSHSTAFLPRPAVSGGPSARDSAFVTFCGFGEVVEYRFDEAGGGDGFRQETLFWKKVGQLPHSGEWIQTADADNDGRTDVVVATGYAFNGAAIHIFESKAAGAPLELRHKIEEDGRFGNVRFLVGDFRGTGAREVISWWCTDLAGGDAEMILYRLGPKGVVSREVVARGTASDLWSNDGQFVTGDTDRDGREEVWFGTLGGSVWKYDPSRASAPVRVARFQSGLGPLAIGPDLIHLDQPVLYVAADRSILRFRQK